MGDLIALAREGPGAIPAETALTRISCSLAKRLSKGPNELRGHANDYWGIDGGDDDRRPGFLRRNKFQPGAVPRGGRFADPHTDFGGQRRDKRTAAGRPDGRHQAREDPRL